MKRWWVIKQGKGLVEGRESRSGLLSLQELERLGLIQVDKDDDVIRYRFYLKHKDFDGEELLINISVIFALAKVAKQSGDIGLQRKVSDITSGYRYGVVLDKKLFSVDRKNCFDGCVVKCGDKELKIRGVLFTEVQDGYDCYLSFNKLKQFVTEFGSDFLKAIVDYQAGYRLEGVTGYIAEVVIVQDGKYKQVRYTLVL